MVCMQQRITMERQEQHTKRPRLEPLWLEAPAASPELASLIGVLQLTKDHTEEEARASSVAAPLPGQAGQVAADMRRTAPPQVPDAPGQWVPLQLQQPQVLSAAEGAVGSNQQHRGAGASAPAPHGSHQAAGSSGGGRLGWLRAATASAAAAGGAATLALVAEQPLPEGPPTEHDLLLSGPMGSMPVSQLQDLIRSATSSDLGEQTNQEQKQEQGAPKQWQHWQQDQQHSGQQHQLWPLQQNHHLLLQKTAVPSQPGSPAVTSAHTLRSRQHAHITTPGVDSVAQLQQAGSFAWQPSTGSPAVLVPMLTAGQAAGGLERQDLHHSPFLSLAAAETMAPPPVVVGSPRHLPRIATKPPQQQQVQRLTQQASGSPRDHNQQRHQHRSASASPRHQTSTGKRNKAAASGSSAAGGAPTCQVPGCARDLSRLKDYHQRYRICDVHIKLPEVRGRVRVLAARLEMPRLPACRPVDERVSCWACARCGLVGLGNRKHLCPLSPTAIELAAWQQPNILKPPALAP